MPTGLAAVALLVVGLVALLPDCASACTCAMMPGGSQEQVERALEESNAVFAGKVVNIKRSLVPVEPGATVYVRVDTVSFRVSEVWKGPEREILDVSTSSEGPACGYPFNEGQEYLLYSYGKEEPFKTDICTETKPLSGASPDFKVLGNGASVGNGGDTLSDTSGGFPRLDMIGMLGLGVAAVSLVVLRRLARTG